MISIRNTLLATLSTFPLMTSAVSNGGTKPNLDFNHKIESFSKAKKLLLKNVYHDHRTTIYCGATFNMEKAITEYNGYSGTKYPKRAMRIEWEHIVPAHNFGQTFEAWRTGVKACVIPFALNM